MIVTSLFAVSGLAILLLVVRPFFISNAISKGDKHTREFYHRVVHFYSESKEQLLFLLNKQVPIRSRNSLNKLLIFLKKKREQYFVSMRDSRLLKKSDGISEFFKNMSSIEKGNGEINDVYEDAGLNDRPVGRGSKNHQEKVE